MERRVKHSKVLIIIGSIFLLIMAIFHGSGIAYVTELMNESDAKSFLKEIFPIVFANVSLHLIALSILGFITLGNIDSMKKVLLIISVFVAIDSLLAFYLRAWFPGLFLMLTASCFLLPIILKRE
nr:hypothetical protein [Allomuricauda sp.]